MHAFVFALLLFAHCGCASDVPVVRCVGSCLVDPHWALHLAPRDRRCVFLYLHALNNLPHCLRISTVAGYGACVEIGLAQEGNAIFADNLQPWIRAFFSLSLTTNLLATCELFSPSGPTLPIPDSRRTMTFSPPWNSAPNDNLPAFAHASFLQC